MVARPPSGSRWSLTHSSQVAADAGATQTPLSIFLIPLGIRDTKCTQRHLSDFNVNACFAGAVANAGSEITLAYENQDLATLPTKYTVPIRAPHAGGAKGVSDPL